MLTNSPDIYTQEIKLSDLSNIYTHDELPEGLRFKDEQSLGRKLDTVLASFRNLGSILKSVPSKMLTSLYRNPYSEYCDPEKAETWNKWKQDSTGLHVLTHGFQGHPFNLGCLYQSITGRDPTADVRVPFR